MNRQEEFESKFSHKLDYDTYDYSQLVYNGSGQKVKIRCIMHDIFFDQLLSDHIQGHKGCPKCSTLAKSLHRRKTHDSFINELLESQPGFFLKYGLISRYVNNRTPIYITSKYGIVKMYPQSLIKGAEPSLRSAVSKKQYYINQATELHNRQFDYNISSNNFTNVSCKCRKCGVTSVKNKHSHLAGDGCNVCSSKRAGINARKSLEEFIKESIRLHGGKYDYSKVEYLRSDDKVIIICNLHQEEFLQKPYVHLQGCSGCHSCQGKIPDEETLRKRIKEKHENFYSYDEKIKFKKLTDLIRVNCPKHGESWQSITRHLNSIGCPTCSKVMKEALYFRNKNVDLDHAKCVTYVLKFELEDEIFYKVGVSTDFKIRYANLKSSSYTVTVELKIEGTIRTALELESQFLKDFKRFKYKPKITFPGHTECLSINPLNYYYEEEYKECTEEEIYELLIH